MEARTTSQPDDAALTIAAPHARISTTQWELLSTDLMNGYTASLGARAALEENLRDWEKLVEMDAELDQGQLPWPNASNVVLPIVPSQLKSALAYIVAKTLVPRLILVTGNTADAQAQAHLVERYYNAELVRQRGRDTWFEELITWLHLGLRDGLGIMEATWRRTKSKRRIRRQVPRMQEGVPVLGPDLKPVSDEVVDEVEIVNYDAPLLRAVQLKDFGYVPAHAFSVEQAVAVWTTEWLYESDLRQMEREGTLRWDYVEAELSYVESGSSDGVASDRQGSYDKSAGGQINTGMSQGSQNSPFFVNRGPIKVIRIHSRQYNLSGGTDPEEIIFWWGEKTQKMLGYTYYEYLTEERCFFEFAPDPRPGRAEGYSFVELLASLSAEISKMYNDRNNAIDIKLKPPRIKSQGAVMDDNDADFGPGVEWEGDKDAVSFLSVPDIPIASSQQEAMTKNYISELTGQNQPMMGAQSSGRRTATENRIQQASTGTRNDLVAMRFRVSCRALFNFVHRLNLQYLPGDAQGKVQGSDANGTFTLPRELLALDYRIDISGASDPIDAASRLNQDMGIYQLLSSAPDIQQDPVKMYALRRMLLEDSGKTNIEQLIGTQQEAQQRAQQMAQMAQQQAAMGGGQPQQGGPPHGNR